MQLTDLTWPDVAALDKHTPVIIPVAALEQHGPHLPLFTDSLLLGEIVRRLALTAGDHALFAPLLWLGNSEHHLDFPGTLSAAPRVYLDLLSGLLDNFIAHGFTRILLLNGHGGNDIPGRHAIFETRQRYRERNDLLLLLATYWAVGTGSDRGHQAPALLDQDEMGHACEWETSMMLRLAPQLVGSYRELAPVAQGSGFAPAHRGWNTRDRTQSGYIGQPGRATAEKGEALFQRFTEDVAALLERVIRWNGTSWEG